MLRLLDLFSGIGGMSLGLERTGGFKTVAFCEIDPFCRAVLARHWPYVHRYDDVRGVTAARLRADGVAVDAICGGFPCQDVSAAGARAGLDGSRSGLWSEVARLVGELRPRLVLVENVAALLHRGMDRVLGDLSALRYDAQWVAFPASALGAPHHRDRVWVVAYPHRDPVRLEPGRGDGADRTGAAEPGDDGAARDVADPDRVRQLQPQRRLEGFGGRLGDGGQALADAVRAEPPGGNVVSLWSGRAARDAERCGLVADAAWAQRWAGLRQDDTLDDGAEPGDDGGALSDPDQPRLPFGIDDRAQPDAGTDLGGRDRRASQSAMGLLTDGLPEELVRPELNFWPPGWEDGVPRTVGPGVPDRVAQVRALGNAVVPQAVEAVGRAALRVINLGHL